MNRSARIFVAGHRGLVGSAIVRRLLQGGYDHLILRGRDELDLTDQRATRTFFEQERPEYVFLAAAKVGGIHANNAYPADFISTNLAIQSNVLQAAHETGVKKLLFLGSSCIYPRDCPQPIREEYLLSGPLEATNAPYAVAKIAGIQLCEAYNRQYGCDFLCVMPSNLYGPEDRYDLATSHVLPAIMRKMHEAKTYGVREVTLWGTGAPFREFLYSDDLADACVFLMERHGARDIGSIINVGTGEDVPIRELARLIAREVGFEGSVIWDAGMPNGTPRKLLDVRRITELGWRPRIGLQEGISLAYRHFRESHPSA